MANIKKVLKLEGLNIKEFYAWPVSVHLLVGGAILLVTVSLGGLLFIKPTNDKLNTVIKKEETLKKEYVDKRKLAVNLDLYLEQLEQVKNDSEALLKQLPNKSEMESLLVDINQAGLSRGLNFELFKPEKEKLLKFYAEQPISIRVKGSYKSLGEFTSDIAQLSRVVILTDMTVTTKDNSVVMDVTAKTFRYLDQEEIDEQRRIAEEAKKSKDKKNKSAKK